MTTQRITIILDGGIVQEVRDLPPDVELVFHDYDIDDPANYDSTDLNQDADGNQYVVYNWPAPAV